MSSPHTGGCKGYKFTRAVCPRCARIIAVSFNPDGKTAHFRKHRSMERLTVKTPKEILCPESISPQREKEKSCGARFKTWKELDKHLLYRHGRGIERKDMIKRMKGSPCPQAGHDYPRGLLMIVNESDLQKLADKVERVTGIRPNELWYMPAGCDRGKTMRLKRPL